MGRGSGREDWHLLFKIIIIGDAGAGKSCLLHSFLENHNFLRNSSHTCGVEFGSKIVEVGGKRIKLQIWDTAGQERFKSVTKSYFRGAAGAIIVYDVTSKESFSHVMSWLAEARQLASPGIVGVVAGNKSDLQESREVTFLEGSSLAQSNELIFLESSALSGVSVDEIFLKCALRVLNKYEAGELDLKQVSIVSSGVASSTGDGRLMVGRAGERTSSSCSC